jgi:hypothetical protein
MSRKREIIRLDRILVGKRHVTNPCGRQNERCGSRTALLREQVMRTTELYKACTSCHWID